MILSIWLSREPAVAFFVPLEAGLPAHLERHDLGRPKESRTCCRPE
jgi:hypothetical protein